MNYQEGFKVVHRIMQTNDYHSFSAPESGSVIYKPDQWTERQRNCGPLAVFIHRRHAEIFMADMAAHESDVIFPCYWVPSLDTMLWVPSMLPLMQYSHVHQSLMPYGTRFADKVMIRG